MTVSKLPPEWRALLPLLAPWNVCCPLLQLFHSLKFIPTLQPLGGEMSLEYAGWGGREPSLELTISTLVPSFPHCPHTFRTKQNLEVGPQDWRKNSQVWRVGPAVQVVIAPGFSSWHSHGRPQVSATPIQGIRIPSFGLHRHLASMWYTHTHTHMPRKQWITWNKTS